MTDSVLTVADTFVDSVAFASVYRGGANGGRGDFAGQVQQIPPIARVRAVHLRGRGLVRVKSARQAAEGNSQDKRRQFKVIHGKATGQGEDRSAE